LTPFFDALNFRLFREICECLVGFGDGLSEAGNLVRFGALGLLLACGGLGVSISEFVSKLAPERQVLRDEVPLHLLPVHPQILVRNVFSGDNANFVPINRCEA